MNNYSVALLTYKRKELFTRCLISILNQTTKPNEIIIIDQNTDNSMKRIVKQFQDNNKPVDIKYVHMKKKNVSIGRNVAIQKSSNNYLLFTDDDCEVEKDWGKNAVYALGTHQLVLGNCLMNNQQQGVLALIQHRLTDSYFALFRFQMNENGFQSYIIDTKNCAMNKKGIIKHKISFNPRQPYIEDMDFSYQAYINNISIRYEPKMRIWHTYKDNLFDALKSQFKLGHNFQILDKRWEKNLRIKALNAYVFTKHMKKNSIAITPLSHIYLLFSLFRKLGYAFGTIRTVFLGT
ncbi:MAG: glycosyltransferase [Microgenomates group bacterium]